MTPEEIEVARRLLQSDPNRFSSGVLGRPLPQPIPELITPPPEVPTTPPNLTPFSGESVVETPRAPSALTPQSTEERRNLDEWRHLMPAPFHAGQAFGRWLYPRDEFGRPELGRGNTSDLLMGLGLFGSSIGGTALLPRMPLTRTPRTRNVPRSAPRNISVDVPPARVLTEREPIGEIPPIANPITPRNVPGVTRGRIDPTVLPPDNANIPGGVRDSLLYDNAVMRQQFEAAERARRLRYHEFRVIEGGPSARPPAEIGTVDQQLEYLNYLRRQSGDPPISRDEFLRLRTFYDSEVPPSNLHHRPFRPAEGVLFPGRTPFDRAARPSGFTGRPPVSGNKLTAEHLDTISNGRRIYNQRGRAQAVTNWLAENKVPHEVKVTADGTQYIKIKTDRRVVHGENIGPFVEIRIPSDGHLGLDARLPSGNYYDLGVPGYNNIGTPRETLYGTRNVSGELYGSDLNLLFDALGHRLFNRPTRVARQPSYGFEKSIRDAGFIGDPMLPLTGGRIGRIGPPQIGVKPERNPPLSPMFKQFTHKAMRNERYIRGEFNKNRAQTTRPNLLTEAGPAVRTRYAGLHDPSAGLFPSGPSAFAKPPRYEKFTYTPVRVNELSGPQAYTLNRTTEWLGKSNIKFKISHESGGSLYVHADHPITNDAIVIRISRDGHVTNTSSGQGKAQIALFGEQNVFDTGTVKSRIGAEENPRITRNVSGEPYADPNVLADALAHRFSKSPSGQWLVPPGRERVYPTPTGASPPLTHIPPMQRGRYVSEFKFPEPSKPRVTVPPKQLDLPFEGSTLTRRTTLSLKPKQYREVRNPAEGVLFPGRTPFDRTALPRGKRYTEEQRASIRQDVINLAGENLDAANIAKRLGVSPVTALKVLKREGLFVSNQGRPGIRRTVGGRQLSVSREDTPELIRRYTSGEHVGKLASEYNISRRTISNILKREGVSARNPRVSSQPPEHTVNAVRRLRTSENLTPNQIAENLDLKPTEVATILNRLRKRGEIPHYREVRNTAEGLLFPGRTPFDRFARDPRTSRPSNFATVSVVRADEINELRRQGMTVDRIAGKLNVSPSTVYKVITSKEGYTPLHSRQTRNRLGRGGGNISQDQINTIVNLHDKRSVLEISRITGLDELIIKRAISILRDRGRIT